MTWKGLWLGEPHLAPDVAGKWLFKTKIGIRVLFLQAKGCFSRSHTWFVYIQFLITISSPFTPWSKKKTDNLGTQSKSLNMTELESSDCLRPIVQSSVD